MPKPDTSVYAAFDVGFNPGLLIRSEVRALTEHHELAILDFQATKPVIPTEGSWVTVTFGRMPQWSKTFYGYVNHIERVDDQTMMASTTYRLWCLGTSKPMNSINPGRWSGVTGSFIARTYAERYALRSVISKSTQTLDWAQGNASDFTSLRDLAKREGMLTWVSGSTLYYVDPAKQIVSAASNTMKTFTRSYPAQTEALDTLGEMRLIQGSDAPGIGAPQNTLVFGTDSAGRLVKASSARAYADAGLVAPTSTTIHPGSAGSAAEAAALASAHVYAANWAQMTADIRSDDAPVYVGDVVNLAGTGVDSGLQGRWFVSGIADVLTYNSVGIPYTYTMNVTLIRNQANTHATVSTKNLTGGNPIVPAIWLGNRWQAKTLETTYV